MKENITNRPDLEDARQEELSENHAHAATVVETKPDEDIDSSPLPKGMRERIETVEVSTFKPKG
jgi:hypothetical protein